MKRTLFLLSLAALSGSVAFCASKGLAQEPTIGVPPRVTLSAPIAVEEVQVTESQQLAPSSVTPEMWLYTEQMRRYDDPAQAVRRKAEYKAAQRLNRLAALQWFGFSNARPQAAATPFMGVYSPAWVGNGYDRYDWVGSSWPVTTVRVESTTIAR